MAFIRNLVVCLLWAPLIYSQEIATYESQFRIKLDEDFINVRALDGDKAYTAGFHLDWYYRPSTVLFFLDRWLPRAGKESITNFGFGVSQQIFTPGDIKSEDPNYSDYPYSGALYLRHAHMSYNPVKEYAIKSEIAAGVMGPSSLARNVQVYLHERAGDEKPRGWNNQLPNDLLLNMHMEGEKKLLSVGKAFELVGGVDGDIGTMLNAGGVHMILRAGKMIPYFTSPLAQQGVPDKRAKSRIQAYFSAKPQLRFIGYNALLEGGMVLRKSKPATPEIRRLVSSLDYGITLSFRNLSLSFTQMMYSSTVKGLSGYETGSLGLYFSW